MDFGKHHLKESFETSKACEGKEITFPTNFDSEKQTCYLQEYSYSGPTGKICMLSRIFYL